ncbi:MAG: hypothetical protein ACYCWE_20790 [Eubacteriales bacterium]
MVKTEVKSTEYKDGKRIDTVEHTYTLADDIARLGQLYYGLGQKLESETDEKEIAAFHAMINAQHEIIKGYGDKNVTHPAAE